MIIHCKLGIHSHYCGLKWYPQLASIRQILPVRTGTEQGALASAMKAKGADHCQAAIVDLGRESLGFPFVIFPKKREKYVLPEKFASVRGVILGGLISNAGDCAF